LDCELFVTFALDQFATKTVRAAKSVDCWLSGAKPVRPDANFPGDANTSALPTKKELGRPTPGRAPSGSAVFATAPKVREERRMAFGSIPDSHDCTEKFLASRHSVNLSCARIPATPHKISTIRTAAAT
jgi:hypothetical protein